MNLPDRALAFARAAHGEQKRKYTGNPYIEHPIRGCSSSKRREGLKK